MQYTGVIMKRFFFFFILFTIFFTKIYADFNPLIQKQLPLMHQKDEYNITHDEMIQITQKQEIIYRKTLEDILHHKKDFLNQPQPYQNEILMLEKSIKFNKDKNNTYAVLRDEVLTKSYRILQAQNKMSRHILRALDLYDFQKFNQDMNDKFIENQLAVQEIDTIDYRPYLALKENNAVLQEAQKNIKDYYAILEINSDMLKYFSIFEDRMYRLNKYEAYHVLPLAIYLDDSILGKKMNPFLYAYNLSMVKLFLILTISLFIYIFRLLLRKITIRLFKKVNYGEKYSHAIMDHVATSVNVLFFIIILHIVIHIYNNFYTTELFTKIFNITYSLLFSLILYRVINTVALVSINDIEQSNLKIKREIINIGLKIINFAIIVMGLLLVLHFAGANLTAVLSGLGIGGLAIAFAARETLANFLGTISILASDIYSQGDKISVDDKRGTVTEIGLRVTTLRTFENALISIPNGVIANKDVINWSRRKIGRLIKMTVGLKYDSEAENIRNVIEEIREMLENHTNIATPNINYEIDNFGHTKLVSIEDSHGIKRTLFVHLDELADSSINILIYCFTIDTSWDKWLQTKEDIIFEVMAILKKNHLEFAYPSMSLYHENK
jgi:MscS family membrane protein